MEDKDCSSHPKQVILEYFDSLVNKVDLYTEELLEKYPKHELLEVSESGDNKKNSLVKWNPFNFKTRNQLSDSSSDSSSDDSDDSINDTSDSDSDSNNEVSSDDTSDSGSDSDDELSSDDSSDSDSDSDDEETDSDDSNDSNDSFGPKRKRRRIEVSDNDDDNNKGRTFEESSEDEIDQNQDNKETEEDDTEDLNTYSYHDYDESDENDENMNESDEEDDNEAYEYKIYEIEEFIDPYHFDHKSDRHSHLKVRDRKSITTNDYLNKIRSFLIDEIRNEERRSLESYESNKAGYNFNSYSLEEMKKKLFKKRFCFLFDTKTDLKSDDFRSSRRRQKTKKRVFSLCLIISDFYLNDAQINQIQ